MLGQYYPKLAFPAAGTRFAATEDGFLVYDAFSWQGRQKDRTAHFYLAPAGAEAALLRPIHRPIEFGRSKTVPSTIPHATKGHLPHDDARSCFWREDRHQDAATTSL